MPAVKVIPKFLGNQIIEGNLYIGFELASGIVVWGGVTTDKKIYLIPSLKEGGRAFHATEKNIKEVMEEAGYHNMEAG